MEDQREVVIEPDNFSDHDSAIGDTEVRMANFACIRLHPTNLS